MDWKNVERSGFSLIRYFPGINLEGFRNYDDVRVADVQAEILGTSRIQMQNIIDPSACTTFSVSFGIFTFA
jgi:hypothetical protein